MQFASELKHGILPEEDSVFDLVVDVSSVLGEWEDVGQVRHRRHVLVDPVGKRPLFLFEDHVVAVPVLACNKGKRYSADQDIIPLSSIFLGRCDSAKWKSSTAQLRTYR